VSFKEIIKNAIERNCDIDKDGNIDGAVFAAEQILQDMEKEGYSILTKTGKIAASGIASMKKQPKKRKRR
jgi:hypothetical protein